MENESVNPEDELKAENEVLRLKLELEHGMQHGESNLPADVENQWLNHVYSFEQQWENAKRISVYEFIGKPAFKSVTELSAEEVESELTRLLEVMLSCGVSLDMCCEYPCDLIYKFITDELFAHETDDIHVPGMMHCFIYEEFHPNHAYDLERHSRDYADAIFSKRWDKEYSLFIAAKTIFYNGVEFQKEELSEKIIAFQELHANIELINFDVVDLQFTLDNMEAKVQTESTALVKFETGEIKELRQPATFYYRGEYWEFYKLEMENFSI